ncbi:restriction endonuclease subunit S [Mesorhizobium sp. LNHC221B00]|nr:restriction endonuclease subunit S [Mesorhizobium sp. LNHC221B00]
MPLPPLREQQRIAAILDKSDVLRRKRKRAVELLDNLTQSIFFELFGHTSDDISNWGDPIPLSDLAEIGSGITKGRKLNGQSTRPVPYLAVANVQDRRLELTNVKTIHATESEISRHRLRKDDLLLTEGGDPDKLGRGTLWADELSEAIHQNHIFRVRINSNAVLPLFLNWLVASPYGKRYFLGVAKQTTGIASINKTQLSEFPTIVPPIDLQRRFARMAQSIGAETERVISSLTETQLLFASLQQRAFDGEFR